MHIAIINQTTNRVENIVVPPQGSNVYFVADGYYGVLSSVAKIGDTYDIDTQQFNEENGEN